MAGECSPAIDEVAKCGGVSNFVEDR